MYEVKVESNHVVARGAVDEEGVCAISKLALEHGYHHRSALLECLLDAQVVMTSESNEQDLLSHFGDYRILAPGQVWESCDVRRDTVRVVIEALAGDDVQCLVNGKETRIKRTRFKPWTNGYRYVRAGE